MDAKSFKKKAIEEFSKTGGFLWKREIKKLYRCFDDYAIVVDFQKSNYSNGYYVNFSIIILSLHKEDFLAVKVPDLFGRIGSNSSGFFDLNESDDLLSTNLENAVKRFVSIFEGGLRRYLEVYPEAIHVVPVKSRSYFEQLLK